MVDHFRLVYTCTKSKAQIVSMTHQPRDKAVSMANLCNKAARHGQFTVEDEFDVQQQAS